MEEIRFFDPLGELIASENRLPHWQQGGTVYFVTFHLADSIPQVVLSDWISERNAWLKSHPEPWDAETEREFHRRFSGARERWLDAGHGSCALRNPKAAQVLGEALSKFEGERFRMLAWVVMPSHVHALFSLCAPWTLEEVLHGWKSYTAHVLQRQFGVTGRVWMQDYFDRLVRDYTHFANCVHYIRRNPEKAGLPPGEFLLWESAVAREIE